MYVCQKALDYNFEGVLKLASTTRTIDFTFFLIFA